MLRPFAPLLIDAHAAVGIKREKRARTHWESGTLSYSEQSAAPPGRESTV